MSGPNTPRCAADCIAHCRRMLTPDEQQLTIAMIDLLVEVARRDAAIEAIEESHRRTMRLLNAPLAVERAQL